MRKLEIFEKTKTYMYPNGNIATANDIIRDFPAVASFKHVIETDEAGEVCFAVMNFNTVKAQYGIEQSVDDEEAIALIEEKMNTVQVSTPSAEERIAAAMEFQNMVTIANISEQ